MEPFGNSTDIDTISNHLRLFSCVPPPFCHWLFGNVFAEHTETETIRIRKQSIIKKLWFQFMFYSQFLHSSHHHLKCSSCTAPSVPKCGVSQFKISSHTVSIQYLDTQSPPKTVCSAFLSSFPSFSFSLFLYKIAHIQTLAGENSKWWSCQWEHTSKISIREEVGYRHESWKSHFLLKEGRHVVSGDIEMQSLTLPCLFKVVSYGSWCCVFFSDSVKNLTSPPPSWTATSSKECFTSYWIQSTGVHHPELCRILDHNKRVAAHRDGFSTPGWRLELPAPQQTHFIWLTEHAWATNGMSDCLLSRTHSTVAASLRCKHGGMIGGTTRLASPKRVSVRHFSPETQSKRSRRIHSLVR